MTGSDRVAGLASSALRSVRRLVSSEYLVFWLCVVYVALLGPFTPGMATTQNAANVLASLLPLLILATGQTVVLITGGIELSLPSIIALTSVAGASVMTTEGGWLAGHAAAAPVGVAVMLGLGTLLGALNGACVVGLRMPAFMVTLTTMMFWSGFAVWFTQSQNLYGLPNPFLRLGGKTWLALVLSGAFALAVHLVLRRTLPGHWLYAVGQNPRAARVAGVPVGAVTLGAYALAGLSAGLASVLLTGRLETASPVLGREMLLDVIGATVIGGTSLFGGKGKVLWTGFGVLFLTLIDNSLNLLNCSHFTIMMIKGGVILAAAVLDALRHRHPFSP